MLRGRGAHWLSRRARLLWIVSMVSAIFFLGNAHAQNATVIEQAAPIYLRCSGSWWHLESGGPYPSDMSVSIDGNLVRGDGFWGRIYKSDDTEIHFFSEWYVYESTKSGTQKFETCTWGGINRVTGKATVL
jgi:hypothetical protein